LVGILSCGEIICSSADSLKPDDLGRLGRNIVDSGRRLHRLTQQFIAYAQIEHLSMDPSELEALRLDYAFNADQTISAVARSKAAAAGRTDDLKLRLTDSAVAMCPDFLTKLIEELVDNAFKFSATGTPVVINGFTWTDRFVLEVSDCGRGMSEDQLSEVAAFVQFQRRIYEQTGAGLGLAIAKRLIELHDGRFEIRSQINKGTCVSVALPIPNPGGSNLSPEEPFVRSPP
jgi:signal transduction histidine kinase